MSARAAGLPVLWSCAWVVALTLGAPALRAAEIDLGDPDIRLRWDNTVEVSTAWRLEDPSDRLTGAAVGGNGIDYGANQDDGDRNFDKGFISRRVDWLSELELSTWDKGLRVSVNAWYDDVYNKDGDHDSPATSNRLGSGDRLDDFPDETRRQHGRNIELLDAFGWVKFDIGEMPVTLRAGRHALVYGETVFFGDNGIAVAQGPIDQAKMLANPSTQFKDVLRPVEQVSASLQVTPELSLGGYAQVLWHETRIPAVGSYFSNLDFVGAGAESFIIAPGGPRLEHSGDLEPDGLGQFGLQARWSPGDGDWQFGFYGARYHAKTPSGMYTESFVPAGPTTAPTSFRWAYAEDITTLGASATTSFGPLNVAGEASVRFNAPLNSRPQANPGPGGLGTGAGDNDETPLYAVGTTGHLNLSGIYLLSPSALWDGGSVVGEVGFNTRLSTTENSAALDPNTTRTAGALRMIFTPAYFQVLPGLDLEVPIGLGYNFLGRSSAVANFNGGAAQAGDFSIGLEGTYLGRWQFGLNYVRYFGDSGQYLEAVPTPAGAALSFDQSRQDRDFIALNFTRAF